MRSNIYEDDLLDMLFFNIGITAKEAETALRQMGQSARVSLATVRKNISEHSHAPRIPNNYDNRFTPGLDRIHKKQ